MLVMNIIQQVENNKTQHNIIILCLCVFLNRVYNFQCDYPRTHSVYLCGNKACVVLMIRASCFVFRVKLQWDTFFQVYFLAFAINWPPDSGFKPGLAAVGPVASAYEAPAQPTEVYSTPWDTMLNLFLALPKMQHWKTRKKTRQWRKYHSEQVKWSVNRTAKFHYF